MAITLYDLAGAEPERRFSPFCWRTKMALAHKGLAFETIPWRFVEKPKIAFANSERVPVIVDDGRPVADSWAIACYLEDTYGERPTLFGGAAGRALSFFVNEWANATLNPAIARMIVCDIFDHVDPGDRDYFRETREPVLGMKLEDTRAGREARLEPFRQSLAPMRRALAANLFVGGAAPLYPDYVVFGTMQWARAISPFVLLERDDPVNLWRERMLDAFDGLGRKAPGYW
jgi:glutathione S-transferase